MRRASLRWGFSTCSSERAKLDQELQQLATSLLQEESRYHYLHAHSMLKQSILDKSTKWWATHHLQRAKMQTTCSLFSLMFHANCAPCLVVFNDFFFSSLPVGVETQCLSGARRLSDTAKSHSEASEKFIADQEALLKVLRKKQVTLKVLTVIMCVRSAILRKSMIRLIVLRVAHHVHDQTVVSHGQY